MHTSESIFSMFSKGHASDPGLEVYKQKFESGYLSETPTNSQVAISGGVVL